MLGSLVAGMGAMVRLSMDPETNAENKEADLRKNRRQVFKTPLAHSLRESVLSMNLSTDDSQRDSISSHSTK